jgi:hypothetical protein
MAPWVADMKPYYTVEVDVRQVIGITDAANLLE